MARIGTSLALLAMVALGAPATAQDQPEKKQTEKPKDDSVEAIATQPAKDIGAVKTKVPPLLLEAERNPYGVQGLTSCASLASAVQALNGVLGPDLEPVNDPKDAKKVRITSGTVAGLVVPFRGVVREVSGAAGAQRQLDAATDAGIARRGFLRGVHAGRKCRNAI